MTDGAGASASQPLFKIEVQAAPLVELADAYAYEVGTAIDPIQLPAVTGGTPPLTYSITPALPAGLTFDAATRTISGTPTAMAATAVYTYTVTDGAGASKSQPLFSIEVQASSVELSDAYTFQVGWAIAPVVFPLVTGGTGELTPSLSPALPAGLTFDAATRTISGTPTAEVAATVYTYTVTDEAGASASRSFTIEVVLPPLDAPNLLIAVDYKGADGAGDQGGFIMLTWDLSEDHESLDGYRIFREIPSLDGEMIPWAMIDAVPGVQIGRAIVATLDNAETKWGIAAESDGRSSTETPTFSSAKAAFVGANQYELMAETLMASREAAQAGDVPVFASLLPEALAYAQGVTPRLNIVEGVLASFGDHCHRRAGSRHRRHRAVGRAIPQCLGRTQRRG